MNRLGLATLLWSQQGTVNVAGEEHFSIGNAMLMSTALTRLSQHLHRFLGLFPWLHSSAPQAAEEPDLRAEDASWCARSLGHSSGVLASAQPGFLLLFPSPPLRAAAVTSIFMAASVLQMHLHDLQQATMWCKQASLLLWMQICYFGRLWDYHSHSPEKKRKNSGTGTGITCGIRKYHIIGKILKTWDQTAAQYIWAHTPHRFITLFCTCYSIFAATTYNDIFKSFLHQYHHISHLCANLYVHLWHIHVKCKKNSTFNHIWCQFAPL